MSIPSLSSHLIASARCYRHDYLVMDRRSTATLICDGAAGSCFHTQASLSRSVIGSASSPGGGSKQIADYGQAGLILAALVRRHRFPGYALSPGRQVDNCRRPDAFDHAVHQRCSTAESPYIKRRSKVRRSGTPVLPLAVPTVRAASSVTGCGPVAG
jgi:hypothetical protein